MSRNDRLQATALKNQWKAQLASLPTKDVALMVAKNMLPETTGEALIESGLAAVTGLGTYIVVGALTPALLATGAALGAVAAYNLKTKSDGEIKELVQRVKGWTISKVKKDKVVEKTVAEDLAAVELERRDTQLKHNKQTIDHLTADVRELREELKRLKTKPEPKVVVAVMETAEDIKKDFDADLEALGELETVDPTTLDVAQWAKEE
jgi:hypothetical protein